MKPTALDFYCGRGGWAAGLIKAGYRVIGFDLFDFSEIYPGEFNQVDMLTWKGWMQFRKSPPQLVVASPPCEEYSRWAMPWTRARHPPEPNLALVDRSFAISALLGVPLVLENVGCAQKWLGKSKANCGPFHLWGDVPAILPVFSGKKKESYGSKQRAERAVIPFDLAYHIGKCFLK